MLVIKKTYLKVDYDYSLLFLYHYQTKINIQYELLGSLIFSW